VCFDYPFNLLPYFSLSHIGVRHVFVVVAAAAVVSLLLIM